MKSGAGTGFARESTGLVKNVSLLDAIALNVSYMSTGAALSLIGFTVILLPSVSGVNLVLASLIGFVISIPQVVVYSMMSRRTSRTGGDYVWMSRSLGGFAGSSITFMGITMETMPYLALIAISVVFAVGSVGVALGNSSFAGLAAPGGAPMSQFLLAGGIFTLLIALNIVRPRVGFKLITVLMAIGLLALVASVVTILYAGRSGIESYVDGLNPNNQSLSYDAIAGSYSGSSFDLSATLSVIPFFAIFVYPWFNASASVGSELKSKGAINWNAPLSAILAFLVVTIPLATMYYAGGLGFTNEALANANLVYDNSFNFWTLAMGVSQSSLLSLFIGVGWILWEVAILAFGIITISRYLMAQSLDRFLPSRFAYVSARWNSPVFAHLFDLVVTVALIGFAAFIYGTASALYGAVLAAMVFFLFVGLAAVVFGFRHEKGGARTSLVVCGALMAGSFLFISAEFLAAPSVWGGNVLAYGYILVTFAAGVVIYLAAQARNKSHGMDLSLLFKEIPPE